MRELCQSKSDIIEYCDVVDTVRIGTIDGVEDRGVRICDTKSVTRLTTLPSKR
jgi:hypothetical protein